MAEAQAARREIAAGRWRGPLHGIPYGAKDLIAAEGYPTTWGAEPYREQRFPDATVVARLKQAGAGLVAKLASVEVAGGMGFETGEAPLSRPGQTPGEPGDRGGGA